MLRHRTMRSLLVGVAFLMIASGCAKEYIYTPPASDTGRACTQTCNITQGSCREKEQARVHFTYQQCQIESQTLFEQCKYDALIEYNSCLRYAKDRSACHEDECYQDYCSNTPDFDLCESDYRACYQNCGGIISVKE